MPVRLYDLLTPLRELPEVVEAPLGVTEYWFETFRRVIVVRMGDGCVLLEADLYRDGWGWSVDRVMELDGVRLVYHRLEEPGRFLGARWGELVGLEAGGRRCLIAARLLFCGVDVGREEAWRAYRMLVEAFEGRDPESEPLRVPPPEELVGAERAED
ncbi:MAG: hypothetical protein GXO09_03055 [Crenarchaeota archaeon]|nr:hypothetical protein [Thermoproteota archaeon]